VTRARDVATLTSRVLCTSLEGRLSYQQVRDQRATPPTAGARRLSPIAPNDVAAARSFYEDVLQGRQVWPTEATAVDPGLWFLVDGALIEVCPASGADRPPIVLAVRAPVESAARCWDAGFYVRVHDDAGGRSVLSVVDPFGREIAFARRRTVVRARPTADHSR
jgi:catechol 2,3-dioxygenase-like lactoylglutathione lyase family enzyme